ncbi:type II toxin-antitoxin system Phd/YefM family antitoxin [Glaciimonas sp. GG7]
MQTINIHNAKANLSKLVDAAASGEEIIIPKAGMPTARLMPMQSEKVVLSFGRLKGKIRIADDFDSPLSDGVIARFEGC